VFFEDTLSWGRRVESTKLRRSTPKREWKGSLSWVWLRRSFFTMRVQPLNRLELNFNYNYFAIFQLPTQRS